MAAILATADALAAAERRTMDRAAYFAAGMKAAQAVRDLAGSDAQKIADVMAAFDATDRDY